MAKIVLLVIHVLVSLNLLGAAILFKFAGVPFSVALFTKMSDAVHGVDFSAGFALEQASWRPCWRSCS
jgi:hypothetical protein